METIAPLKAASSEEEELPRKLTQLATVHWAWVVLQLGGHGGSGGWGGGGGYVALVRQTKFESPFVPAVHLPKMALMVIMLPLLKLFGVLHVLHVRRTMWATGQGGPARQGCERHRARNVPIRPGVDAHIDVVAGRVGAVEGAADAGARAA